MTSTINASSSGSGGIVQTADASGVLALQANGTTAFTVNSDATTTFANAATLSGGTANGVTYLNGSKVLTSGSAFVFDGTNVGIGTTSPTYQTQIYGTGQTTAALTDAGNKGGSLLLNTPTVSGGDGGALLFGAGGSGAKPYAAIKGLLADGAGNTTGNLAFSTRNATADTALTERMRIDSSGNVGIGVTPNTWSSIYRALQIGTRAAYTQGAADTYIGNNWYNDGANKYIASVEACLYGQTGGTHVWYTAASGTAGNVMTLNERMRIYNTGNTSMAGGLWLGNIADPGSTIKFAGTVISAGVGTYPLKWNSTSGVVTYDTSSRLVKENIVDSSYGLAEILQLKSRKYFRVDDQRNEIGLIADEVQTVLPEFVPMVAKSIFTKNEADTELIAGGVNYDKLTSVLVKAIQEQQALITSLTARIEALESR